jgi:hypothetical protein
LGYKLRLFFDIEGLENDWFVLIFCDCFLDS